MASSVPDTAHLLVVPDSLIGCKQCQVRCNSLCNEQAIKRIAMPWGQLLQGGDVLKADGENARLQCLPAACSSQFAASAIASSGFSEISQADTTLSTSSSRVSS